MGQRHSKDASASASGASTPIKSPKQAHSPTQSGRNTPRFSQTPAEVAPFHYAQFDEQMQGLSEQDLLWATVVAGQYTILRSHISATCFSATQNLFRRAVVLDLDDTVFTGSYVVPGAVDFARYVVEHPADFCIIVISARHETDRAQTIADLKGIGIELRFDTGHDELHLYTPGHHETPTEWKKRIRKDLWKRRISIIACVGDKHADLDSHNGVFASALISPM